MFDVVGEQWFLVYKVIKFLLSHMYTWETLYLHYMWTIVMHFGVSHSSAHEGTNHDLKSHSCAAKPTMNLYSSANTINIQSSIKYKNVRTSYSKMLHGHARNGRIYQLHSTPLQLERVFYKE